MSRHYNLTVEFRKVCEEFGWTETDFDKEGVTYAGYLACDGNLCGGQSEDEAHEEIYKMIKKKCPTARVLTRFTYMEDLPTNTLGDDLYEKIDEIKEVINEVTGDE